MSEAVIEITNHSSSSVTDESQSFCEGKKVRERKRKYTQRQKRKNHFFTCY